MKNISLFKVTVMVITAALASGFVNAGDKVTHAIKKPQSEIAQIEKQVNFSSLVTKLDSDKNGILSQEEVTASQNTILQEEFSNIDVNQDKQIDEAEFNSYLAEVKGKTTTVAKTDK